MVFTIYKPEGDGPFPAVVLVHGSKNHTIGLLHGVFYGTLPSHSIVTVNYDKDVRVCPQSSLYTSTFTDLAKDALTIVEYLKEQPFIDQDRIGLWADSRGGLDSTYSRQPLKGH